ncbi:MAG: hypothetical protein MR285_07040 [Peptoniphilus sp.]|uniref:hypothetical protein n=1 Tax=Peptoniphilus sp. TaxID=1971214 RepID=UPI0025DBDEC0|nr:hypothetical protein [Peptoniphilus sp.]MCI5643846.1 hypothetical protein [Peptoniphilus sp.]
MAKLKFERLINVDLKFGETIKVPSDEVWRISVYSTQGRMVSINDMNLGYEKYTGIVSAGAVVKNVGPLEYNVIPIQGMAFKEVSNV